MTGKPLFEWCEKGLEGGGGPLESWGLVAEVARKPVRVLLEGFRRTFGRLEAAAMGLLMPQREKLLSGLHVRRLPKPKEQPSSIA